MILIQHACATDQWGTPDEVLGLVRHVLGPIDLDPCTTPEFNERVGALRIYTQEALEQSWESRSLFVNPPGGKQGKFSKTALFWAKLMAECGEGRIGHAIWMGFSVEQLAVTQGYSMEDMLSFPLCIPRKRVKFVKPDGSSGDAPSHANVVVYVPGYIDRTREFRIAFRQLGAVR